MRRLVVRKDTLAELSPAELRDVDAGSVGPVTNISCEICPTLPLYPCLEWLTPVTGATTPCA